MITKLINQVNAVLFGSGESLEHKNLTQGADKHLWEIVLANDLDRLDQGLGSITPNGTDTMFFMHPSQTPKNKETTCVRLVYSIRPLNYKRHPIRVTICNDRLE